MGRDGTWKYQKSSGGEGFGDVEEREWGFWGVIEKKRGVSEDGMAERPNQRRDAEQKMGERGVRNEIGRDRQRLVKKNELTWGVIRCAHFGGQSRHWCRERHR